MKNVGEWARKGDVVLSILTFGSSVCRTEGRRRRLSKQIHSCICFDTYGVPTVAGGAEIYKRVDFDCDPDGRE